MVLVSFFNETMFILESQQAHESVTISEKVNHTPWLSLAIVGESRIVLIVTVYARAFEQFDVVVDGCEWPDFHA